MTLVGKAIAVHLIRAWTAAYLANWLVRILDGGAEDAGSMNVVVESWIAAKWQCANISPRRQKSLGKMKIQAEALLTQSSHRKRQ